MRAHITCKKYGKQWKFGFGLPEEWSDFYMTDENGCGIYHVSVSGEKMELVSTKDWVSAPTINEAARQIRHWVNQNLR
jgi:hypothetical protein